DDFAADEAPEVVGGAQGPLDAGAGDLEGVGAGHDVVAIRPGAVEELGDNGGRLADGLDVDALGAIDGDAQLAALEDDVDHLEAVGGERGLDELSHACRHVRLSHPFTPSLLVPGRQKRGPTCPRSVTTSE